jgi:hypothetical protein
VKVLRGGSAESSNNRWVKFDVELDESDIQANVVQYGLDYDALSVIQKYTMLVKQAELLVTVRMETLGVTGDRSSTELQQDFVAYIKKLKGQDAVSV